MKALWFGRAGIEGFVILQGKVCLFFFFFKKKFGQKNAIILVLPFEEISIQPELYSPTRFRIQGGSLIVTQQAQEQNRMPFFLQFWTRHSFRLRVEAWCKASLNYLRLLSPKTKIMQIRLRKNRVVS